MKVKTKEISQNVYLLTYDTQYNLCMSFVRIQEFYESPKFRNTYFELEEYMDWWAKNYGGGSFDYPSRWNGFNIPGSVLARWLDKVSWADGTIREKEKVLINQIADAVYGDNPSFIGETDKFNDIYIIGVNTESNDKAALEHELAHAFYTLYPEYRESCGQLMEDIVSKAGSNAVTKLLDMGYCLEVVPDEVQAYFSTAINKASKSKVLGRRKVFADNFQKFKKSLKKKS